MDVTLNDNLSAIFFLHFQYTHSILGICSRCLNFDPDNPVLNRRSKLSNVMLFLIKKEITSGKSRKKIINLKGLNTIMLQNRYILYLF